MHIFQCVPKRLIEVIYKFYVWKKFVFQIYFINFPKFFHCVDFFCNKTSYPRFNRRPNNMIDIIVASTIPITLELFQKRNIVVA